MAVLHPDDFKIRDSAGREDNPPAGPRFDTMVDDGRRYQIMSQTIGRHSWGQEVSARDLGPGAPIAKLVREGHIREKPKA